jgi:hypothetical protein
MTILAAQEVPTRAIDGHRITGWPYRTKVETALIIGSKTAAQVHVGLTFILIFVKAYRRRLPDIDDRPSERQPLIIANLTIHPECLSGNRRFLTPRNTGTQFALRRRHSPKGSQQRRIRLRPLSVPGLILQQIDQAGSPQDVRR